MGVRLRCRQNEGTTMNGYVGDAVSQALATDGFIWICAIVSAALVLRAAIGFGDGLIAVPLMSLIIDVSEAVPVILFLSTTMSLYPLWKDRSHIQLGSLGRTSIAAFVGIPLGVALLGWGNDDLMKGILGALLIALAWWQLRTPSATRLEWHGWSYVFGTLAGMLGSAYAMRGIVFSVYGALRGWGPKKFKGTISAFYVASGIVIPITYFGAGLITPRIIGFYLVILPLAVLATVVGYGITDRVDAGVFKRWLWMFLFALGLVLIVRMLIAPAAATA